MGSGTSSEPPSTPTPSGGSATEPDAAGRLEGTPGRDLPTAEDRPAALARGEDTATDPQETDTALSAACLLRLAPLLLPRARRGVVGSSLYAQRLREEIRDAAQD
jgi:hypothetical protein